MLDIDFIPKVIDSMIKFLTPLLPAAIVDQYQQVLSMSPLEQKCFIQREIKPYELSLDEFIKNIMDKHGLKLHEYAENDVKKFKRYLEALCEAV